MRPSIKAFRSFSRITARTAAGCLDPIFRCWSRQIRYNEARIAGLTVFAMHTMQQVSLVLLLLPIVLLGIGQSALCSQRDIVLSGVYEAALDLPRILFVLKREPTSPPLRPNTRFEVNYAFLDTGASGVVLSRETTDLMHVAVHPTARFTNVGVGGVEHFAVSEPLYVGIAGYGEQRPADPGVYKMIGQGRFQVRENKAGLLGQPLDIIGMPAMFGRVVVLDSAATNALEYFAADIKKPDDPTIPRVHLEVALKLKSFLNPGNPDNIPPLPVTACNPVINDVVIQRRDRASRGEWLLDTGATMSLISVRQAARLGLTDDNGKPLVKPDFVLPLGGIGQMVQVPGFEVDRLVIPTLSGRNLIFKGVRVGVHDIAFFDQKKEDFLTLDGVFGSNFLCASAHMQGLLPGDVSETVFDKVVIDMRRAILGFRFRRRTEH